MQLDKAAIFKILLSVREYLQHIQDETIYLLDKKEVIMQAQIHLDDTLLSQAQALSGVQDYDVLLRHALFALIQQESAKQLAKLAGNQPDLNPVPRQREDLS